MMQTIPPNKPVSQREGSWGDVTTQPGVCCSPHGITVVTGTSAECHSHAGAPQYEPAPSSAAQLQKPRLVQRWREPGWVGLAEKSLVRLQCSE